MNVEIQHSSFIHLYLCDTMKCALNLLHRFHSVRLCFIIGNAKCKYEKFSLSQNHLLH